MFANRPPELRRWFGSFAALILTVGIVLSPLRAAAASVPALFAYNAAVWSTTTTALGAYEAVRSEAERPRFNDYECTHVGYDAPSNAPVMAGAGGVHAYDDALELLERQELAKAANYGFVEPTAAAEGAEALAPRASSLFHYTTEEGLNGILESGELNPSLKALNPADARYGNGQYLTDIIPGTRSPGSLSSTFLSVPGQGARFSNFVEIDTTGLNVIEGRPGVFVVPGEGPLDISGRIMSFGQSY